MYVLEAFDGVLEMFVHVGVLEAIEGDVRVYSKHSRVLSKLSMVY